MSRHKRLVNRFTVIILTTQDDRRLNSKKSPFSIQLSCGMKFRVNFMTWDAHFYTLFSISQTNYACKLELHLMMSDPVASLLFPNLLPR